MQSRSWTPAWLCFVDALSLVQTELCGHRQSRDGSEKLFWERKEGRLAAAGAGDSRVTPGTSVSELRCLHETFSRLFPSRLLLSDVFVSAAVSNLGQWLSCVSWF